MDEAKEEIPAPTDPAIDVEVAVPAQRAGERWLPVVGREGRYEVSDLGRVRSVDRIVLVPRHGEIVRHHRRGRMMKPADRRYSHVNLGKGGHNRKVHRLVLEAFVGPCPDGMEGCHNNGNPRDNRLENLRWDTKKANQRDKKIHGTDHKANLTHCYRGHELVWPNLRRHGFSTSRRLCLACGRANSWTRSHGHPAEMRDAYSHAQYAKIMSMEPHQVAENALGKALDADAVRVIRRAAAAGATYASLARQYGVSAATARRVVLRRTWAHLGDE